MPSTIIVNRMTTQHKSSVGIASAFPDVCKTPVPPAPSPIPIPYPNIAMSAMASLKTTKRVKDNKQKVVVKGSAYSMSNGDQPGVAMGVVSNKIMGKSYIKNQSFNVKFEKKGVGRLMDPHGNNSGSNPNGIAPAQGQPPLAGLFKMVGSYMAMRKACDAIKGQQIPEKDLERAYADHGMSKGHAEIMRKHCKGTRESLSVREGNPDCISKIEMGFGGKPGSCGGDSIGNGQHGVLPESCTGLIGEPRRDLNGDKIKGEGAGWKGLSSSTRSEGFIPAELVREKRIEKKTEKDFMDWLKGEGALTGDYDLHDAFDKNGRRIPDGSKATQNGKTHRETVMKDRLNQSLGTTEPGKEMIQHGAQANCSEFFDNNPDEKIKKKKAFGEEKFDRIQRPDPWDKCGDTPPDYIKKGPPILHFDKNGKVYRIENGEQLDNLYKCKNDGRDLPEKWKDHDDWKEKLKDCAKGK